MTRPYGKRPKKTGRDGASSKAESNALKIRLRGKDGAPLSMDELRQGLYDVARKLEPHADRRAKWATLFLTFVDENGEEVRISEESEWTLYPYQSAADEKGL